MEHVVIDEIDPDPNDQEIHTDRRPLTASLGTEHLAIARYVLDPGERLSGSIHAHADQEEVFVVLEGRATFETRPMDADEYRTVSISANEAIRFAPGEFQSGRNAADERLVVLAIGAPRETNDIRIDRISTHDTDVACRDCECDHMRIARREDVDFVCPNCEATLALE